MQFSLATPEDSKKILANVNKVKVHLTTGIVEILDKHQDLLGKVGIDILEIENKEENKNETLKFILQDALVIVSNKGLNPEIVSQTGVYIFAKRVLELGTNLSLDEFSKKIDQKMSQIDLERQKLADGNLGNENKAKIKTRLILLEEELVFDKKVLKLIKDLKS
jgi:F0F1-type ATP synthase epsilon subunit